MQTLSFILVLALNINAQFVATCMKCGDKQGSSGERKFVPCIDCRAQSCLSNGSYSQSTHLFFHKKIKPLYDLLSHAKARFPNNRFFPELISWVPLDRISSTEIRATYSSNEHITKFWILFWSFKSMFFKKSSRVFSTYWKLFQQTFDGVPSVKKVLI